MTVVASKMFQVLECIATDESDVVGLARLIKRTNIPKATLYRLLCDLSSAGLLDHGLGGYSLGTQLFELGNAVPRYKRLRGQAMPYLERLQQQTGETVHLATLERNQMVILDKVYGRFPVRIPTSVGTRLPLHTSALGKATLAASPSDLLESVLNSRLAPLTRYSVCAPGLLERQVQRYREQGWAVETGETINGVGCTAAPIVTSDGTLLGAVSVAGDPRSRTAQSVVGLLSRAASEIGHAMDLEMQAT
jgi:DNA-binding IclR family transcriptional regulator